MKGQNLKWELKGKLKGKLKRKLKRKLCASRRTIGLQKA